MPGTIDDDAPLIPEQRHRLLLDRLHAQGVLRIRDLAALLGVSQMTVRRDIAVLEAAGDVASVQGGVRIASRSAVAPPGPRTGRQSLEMPRKQAIATRAAQLLAGAQVVFLDAGTTCQAVAEHLTSSIGLTVVTTDFVVVETLRASPGVTVLHTGGTVDYESGSSDGPIAARMLERITVDVALLSAGAWSLARGITSPSLDKVLLKRAAMESSMRTLLVADSTKFGLSSVHRALGLEELDGVVTDDGVDPDAQQSIAALDIEVHVVGGG